MLLIFLQVRSKSKIKINGKNQVYGKDLQSFALSFSRSQNNFGYSKFFVPDQNFIYILWQSQTFCARQKNDLHSVKKFLCRHKSFWRGTKCSLIFGLAQKIWTGTKHFGTCKRTRHQCLCEKFGTKKPILLNANHFFVWHKMFVTATICK